VLVRVGAYYHDIGKSKRPYFFVENQLSDANPHEKLTPALSALILSSHVKDGIEIGRKYKLPEKVLDFIPQHHGDGVMAFFYHKAQEEADDPEKVNKADFRYPGPRPQSRETALVSMADSVEAAIRSMHVTGDALEAAVKRIIDGKVADGQLEDSQLSLSDLKEVAQVFTKVLNGIYHNRIEYPDNVQALLRKDENLAEAAAEESRKTLPDGAIVQDAAPAPGGAMTAPSGAMTVPNAAPVPDAPNNATVPNAAPVSGGTTTAANPAPNAAPNPLPNAAPVPGGANAGANPTPDTTIAPNVAPAPNAATTPAPEDAGTETSPGVWEIVGEETAH
ncbi:MAG: HDIG domain-containing protein, partial [Peptococcaceae bacterium]|jgi:putative nucleotidyltransferase with HDIG domain|nr:HDIG domain-containing protein [Peptococcaceae bacterium]